MFGRLIEVALVVAATAAAAAPVRAAPATLDQWVSQVNHQIEQRVRSPENRATTGIATVTFRRGADGRAIDISSKDRSEVGQTTVSLVRRLRDLPPLPAGISSDERITMRFLIGSTTDLTSYDRQLAKMQADARNANERYAALLAKQDTQLTMLVAPH